MKILDFKNCSYLYGEKAEDEDARVIDLFYIEGGSNAFRVKDFGGGRIYLFPNEFNKNIPAWAVFAITELMEDFNKFYNQLNQTENANEIQS